MPRNLPHYTKCASPGEAKEFSTAGNIAWEIFVSIVLGAALGSVYLIVASLLGAVAIWGCAIGIAIGGMLVAALLAFKDWYYNYRLMCIKHDQCAAGTVVGEPHDSLDGDRKLDILIAPFDVAGTEQMLIQQLDEMRAELTDVPDTIDLQNRQILFGYVRGLSSSDQKKLYIKLVDNKMFADPNRSFLRHYFRRDLAIMGSDAFDHSPDDTLGASDPNPMFRYSHEEGDDPEEKVLVPWMHCEVEGYRLGAWLDNVLIGFISGLVAYTAVCVVCDILTVGALDFLCGWVGTLAALVIAFLAWLISHFVNNPNDHVAGGIEVDVNDSDFDTPPTEMRKGDVVYLYGNWVMDMEHDRYFEIHPVKAYYLLCRSESSREDWVLTEEVAASECEFDPTIITGADMERMCKIVKSVENTDPDDTFTTDVKHALALMP